MCAAANLAMAAVLLVRSRGGTAVPRIFGRQQPLPRLRAAMHACLGLGLGVGLLGDVLSVVLMLNVQALLYLASGAVAYLGLRSVRQQRSAVRQRATVDVG